MRKTTKTGWSKMFVLGMDNKVTILFTFFVLFYSSLLFAYDSENDKKVLTAEIKGVQYGEHFIDGIVVTLEITNFSYDILLITRVSFNIDGSRSVRGSVSTSKQKRLDEKDISVIEVEIDDKDWLKRISKAEQKVVNKVVKNVRVLDKDIWKTVNVIVEAE